MFKNILIKLGPGQSSFLITLVALAASVGLYLLTGLVTGHLDVYSAVMAAVIPAVIAPPLSYLILRFFKRLLSAEEGIRDREERYKTLYDESKRAQELYRSLLDSSADAIVIYDLEGKAKFVSPSFTGIFGFTPEDVRDRKIPFVPDSEKEATWAAIDKVVNQGLPCHGFLTRRLTKDGRLLDISISASRYSDHEGRPAGMLAVLRDITATMDMERKLRQAQKMEAVGTLASGIAHDFNNILQAISGYIELMLKEDPGEESRRRYLREMDKIAARAAELVLGLLTFSRQVEPELRLIDLNQVIRDVVVILERTIPKMIGLETNLAENLTPIRGDVHQLEQVLMNLAANAKDAMPDGGALILETEMIRLSPGDGRSYPDLPPGRYVRLGVTDTGQGMDKETLAHIFDPFFTTKGVGEGTGLGLSTVYGVIKAHGGHLTCYSEPDRGTTFRAYLPAAEEGAVLEPIPPAAPGEKPLTGTETILVVDDEEAILEVAREMLESQGYLVRTAGSGEEALAVYREMSGGVDLIMLDLGMPGMGGANCLKQLLSQDPDMKIVIASGYSANGQVKATLESGARAFIRKPYRLNDMLRQVRLVLDG
ncbi:MAG: response regulator [Thermodesulfobacteriota bacterium]